MPNVIRPLEPIASHRLANPMHGLCNPVGSAQNQVSGTAGVAPNAAPSLVSGQGAL